jgi:mannosyltransferase
VLIDRVIPAPTRYRAPAKSVTIRLTVGALLLVGFGLRVWHLGTQSLWLDEALSVIFARQGMRDLLSTLVTQDLHPPLYYVALHFWMGLAGSTEFAVRFVSVIFGLPAIPATFLLGASIFRVKRSSEIALDRGEQVGLIAAAFVTVSPFLIYYSQEARMYSALATFGVCSSLAFWKLLYEPLRWHWWIGYVAFASAALYTQYFGGLIVGFQVVYLVGYWLRQRRRALVGISAIAATGVAYLPWLSGAILQIRRLTTIPDFWKGDFQLSYLVTHMFAAFALGQFAALRANAGIAAIAAAVVLVGLGCLIWRAVRLGGGEAFVLTYLFLPLAALYAIVVRDPKFAERYLIMIAPPFYLVIALGLESGAAWVRRRGHQSVKRAGLVLLGAFGILFAFATLVQVGQIYDGATYRKDDNRGAIAYVEQHAQPGDVVVLMMNTYQVYLYYAKGDVPYEPLQPGGDIDAAAARLNQIVAGRKRLWLLSWNPEWADPSRFVRDSLDQAYTRVPVTQPFTGLGLTLYAIDPTYRFSAKTTPSIAKPVNFGNRLRLLGYDLSATTLSAGQAGVITLYWQAMTPLDGDYIVSLRLKDRDFYWWRRDDRPAAYNYPTMYWRPGQVVTGDVRFEIPPGTPPGQYDLELGVYGQGQGTDLNVLRDGAVATGTAESIAPITVTRPGVPPRVQSLAISHPVDATFGSDLRLLGTSLTAERTARGAPVDVTLWWRAERAPLPDDRIRLELTAAGFDRILEDQEPVSGHYPTNRWSTGEVVVDRHRVTIPTDAPAGDLQLALQVWNPATASPVPTSNGEKLTLGTIAVLDRQRLTTIPTGIKTPTDLRLGGFATLVGSTLDATAAQPGDHVGLTLYWRANGASGDVPYTVFAHLLDSNQIVKAQQDHQPGNGENPTTGWTDGEYIVDRYDLTVAPDAKPGSYDVEVGMYNALDGKRLSVADSSGSVLGDRAIIAKVQIR